MIGPENVCLRETLKLDQVGAVDTMVLSAPIFSLVYRERKAIPETIGDFRWTGNTVNRMGTDRTFGNPR